MEINVSLHDTLISKVKPEGFADKDIVRFTLSQGSSVEGLLKSLGLSSDWVGLIIVNGRQVSPDYVLSDQDRVDLFSPMAGG